MIENVHLTLKLILVISHLYTLEFSLIRSLKMIQAAHFEQINVTLTVDFNILRPRGGMCICWCSAAEPFHVWTKC